MAKQGRKSKLNPEVTERIVLLLKGGNTRRAAALASGIDEKTFYNWINQGEKAASGEFFLFFQSVTRAEAEAEILMVDSIRTAARPHEVIESETITMPDKSTRTVEKRKRVHKPEMAIEWLKRRRRDEWGDNVRIDVDDEITKLMAALAAGRQAETS